MRPVICALLALSASLVRVSAADPLTLILHFDGRHSEQAVSEMKRELQGILRSSGTEVEWRYSGEISPAESFSNLVVVTFHGACEMRPYPPLGAVEGEPLGYAHVSNGEVIPFADVECDRVRSELRSGHSQTAVGDDRVLGRAMGRVLAHEVHHIIDRTRRHEQTGLMRKSLSPQDLMADRSLSLSFSH